MLGILIMITYNNNMEWTEEMIELRKRLITEGYKLPEVITKVKLTYMDLKDPPTWYKDFNPDKPIKKSIFDI